MSAQRGTVWLCDDCSLWESNRDDSGSALPWTPEAFGAGMAALAASEGVPAHWLSLTMSESDTVDEDGEPADDAGRDDFSTSPCNVCGTTLAGSRTRYVMWSR